MCKWGIHKMIEIKDWRSGRNGMNRIIAVDSCIADEVKKLNELGVKTVGSCCGHNKENQHPHILVEKDSTSLLDELSYKYEDYEGVLLMVFLKAENLLPSLGEK